MLATLVEETAFLHAREIAIKYAARFRYGRKGDLPDRTEPWRASMLTILARHPHQLYFKYLTATAKDSRWKMLKKVAQSLDITAMQTIERPLFINIHKVDPKKSEAAQRSAFVHNELCYWGLVHSMRHVRDSLRPVVAIQLYLVSPHSPLAVVAMIQDHWPKIAIKANVLQIRYQDNLVVLAALARRHLAERRYVEARQALKRYVKRSSDEWGYVSLADTYRLAGDDDRWLETLEEFLDLDISERQKGNVYVQITRYFMDRKDFKTAIRYADAAVDRKSMAGLMIAGECHEYAKNWSIAERYFQLTSDVDLQRLRWFQFCLRTGHGDMVSARTKALKLIDEIHNSSPRSELAAVGHLFLLDNQPVKAIIWLQRANAKQVDPYDSLHIALAAQQLGNTKVRDRALKDAAEKGRLYEHEGRKRPEMIRIAKAFQQALSGKSPALLDIQSLERTIRSAPYQEQAKANYFVGRFAELIGQHVISRQFYQKCSAASVLDTNRTLACLYLRERGYEPNDVVFK